MPSIYEQLNLRGLSEFGYTPYSLDCLAKTFKELREKYITQGKAHNPYDIMAHANPAFNFFDTLKRKLPNYFDMNYGKSEQNSHINARFTRVE